MSPDRYARWGVFLAMNIAPMYPVGLVLDALVANPIEFWSGENPVKGSPRWRPQTESAQAGPGNEGAEPLRLVRTPDALLAFDAQGALVARVTDIEGRPAIVAGSLLER